MKVFCPEPADRISSMVTSILVIEHDRVSGLFRLPLFANGTPTLLFSTVAVQLGTQSGHLFLFGQTVRPDQLLVSEPAKIVAYFLRPEAVGLLFDVCAAELTDQPIALDLLVGKRDFKETLLNAATTPEVLGIMDQYLYRQSLQAKAIDLRLTYAVNRIARLPEKTMLRTVQQELNLTERSFERLFEHHIGVSPNQFRRISQFSHVFRQINTGGLAELSAVAYRHGFADQSHFNRSFKEFTNLTPSAYLQLSRNI
jgi:AraC-like DNA-binding protein